ncbi:hypothetical protein [Devosia sp. Leaf64]|jgi:hypothetical protein|uniref:hypothetical protein n=1 Tax=Devosia sp. Leaf64 TaxID=1736229 RepID=UPI000715DBDB|nr:hypothetical protein [Devosia sp. Leaf64]KQN73959.1 hypothetical protein ASE94_02810 [Devosia sp. Leaf64]
MRKTVLAIAATVAMVSPAFAVWQVDDESDDQGFLFIASQVDETDTIEVQLICDEFREGALLFSVFTGIPLEKQKHSMPDAPIAVRFGNVAFDDLMAEVVDLDTERVLDVSESDHPEVRQIAHAIAKGKEMVVTYRDEQWVLAGDNASPSVGPILENCP